MNTPDRPMSEDAPGEFQIRPGFLYRVGEIGILVGVVLMYVFACVLGFGEFALGLSYGLVVAALMIALLALRRREWALLLVAGLMLAATIVVCAALPIWGHNGWTGYHRHYLWESRHLH
jgi:hypothetical protein